MSESILDYSAMASANLGESLAEATSECHDEIILKHIKALSDDSNVVTIFDPHETAEWVYGPINQSLASYCGGYVTLIDFFTYCCINCQHVLPDLHDLEDLYTTKDGFLVVGVHSAKFEAERLPSNVLNAIQRLNIRHPVLNDPESKLWNRIGVHCWPTLVLLSPDGKPILVLAGEGHRDLLFRVVSVALKYYHESKMINTKNKNNFNFEFDTYTNPTELKYPGKVCINPFSNRELNNPWLTISDSGNNRIILVDYFDNVVHVIGGLDADLKDGCFPEVRFNNPQGTCWIDENILIVCDTGNHVLRRVTINIQKVEILAGTGVQAEFGDLGGLKYCQQALASPWDVLLYRTADMDMSIRKNLLISDDKEADMGADLSSLRRILLVACAGSHQIWAVFLDTTVWWKYKTYAEGTVLPIVGSGREENRNNRYPNSASLAQPSGLTLNGDAVYIADSESSSIRYLDISSGQLSGLAGGDRNPTNLFAFGDIDGKGFAAKLQHPLGVSYCSRTSKVFVADTYNHKIKCIDPLTGDCSTYYPIADSDKTLSEPGGLCVSFNKQSLIVADTNRHRIVSIGQDEDRTYTVLDLKFPDAPESQVDRLYMDTLICPEPLKISRNADGRIVINLECYTHASENSLHLTPEAPQRWTVKILDGDMSEDKINEWDLAGGVRGGKELPGKFEASLKPRDGTPESCYLKIDFFLSLCESGLCFLKKFSVSCELIFTSQAKSVQTYNIYLKLSSGGDTKVNCEEI